MREGEATEAPSRFPRVSSGCGCVVGILDKCSLCLCSHPQLLTSGNASVVSRLRAPAQWNVWAGWAAVRNIAPPLPPLWCPPVSFDRMSSISGAEFARKVQSRLNSQNRAGAIPLTPRLYSLLKLWEYAGLETPRDSVGDRFFVVIDRQTQVSLSEVHSIQLVNEEFRVTYLNGLSGIFWGPRRDGRTWHRIYRETNYNTPWESISVGHIRPAVDIINSLPCRGRRFTNFFHKVVRPVALEMGLPGEMATTELIRYVQVAAPNANCSIRNYSPTYLDQKRNCAATRDVVRLACIAWRQYLEAELMVAQQRCENGGVEPIVMPNRLL